MTFTAPAHRLLVRIVILIALAAAIWSASMLVAGFTVSGQLDSPANPLGRVVPYLAAATMIAVAAVFYYLLGYGTLPLRHWLLWVMAGMVAVLTLFGTFTQAFMTIDGAMGAGFVKETETRIAAATQRAGDIDRAMTALYMGQIAHYERRAREEAVTGRGPRYQQALEAYNNLRAGFGSALGQTLPALAVGSSSTANLTAVLDRLAALKGKAEVLARFAAATGAAAPDFRAEIAQLEDSLKAVAAEGWIDRRALVARQVILKTSEMLASGGTADLGFTLAFILAFIPDLIQVFATCLLVLLRLRQPEAEEPEQPAEDDEADWTPTRTCPWGQADCRANRSDRHGASR